MEAIDLKKAELGIIKQYIELRNKHIKELDTKKVTLGETLDWLENQNMEILGLVKNGQLQGVGIININRNYEFTCFTRYYRQGLGSEIIERLIDLAQKKGMANLWCRVNEENIASINWLKKNNWNVVKKEGKKIIFQRKLSV